MSRRINFVLSDDLDTEVRERCAREGRTISGVIQACLASFVANGLPVAEGPRIQAAQACAAADIARLAIEALGRGTGVKVHCDDVPGSAVCTEGERKELVCLRCSAFYWGFSFVVESVPLGGGAYASVYAEDMLGSDTLPSIRMMDRDSGFRAQLVSDSGAVSPLPYYLPELPEEGQREAIANATAMLAGAIASEGQES